MSGTRVGVMAGVALDTGLPAATTITGSMDTSCRPGIYTISIQYLDGIYKVSTQYLYSVSTQYLHSIYAISTQVLGARAWCWW